ncbi:hypothetical protein UACE39S_04536 [Ureibacillus acetophenoni]
MSLEIKNDFGQIDISNDVIAQIAGGAAIECYGVVGMAAKHQIRDGLTDILRKENFAKGVVIRQQGEDLPYRYVYNRKLWNENFRSSLSSSI